MINEEVRHIVEAELVSGEELLWAEKTDHQAQEFHKQKFLLTPNKRRVVTTVLVLGLMGLAVSFTIIPPGINNWGTQLEILLSNILSTVSLYSSVIAAVLLVLNFLVKGRAFVIGAYGLTNKRLFELDYDLSVVRIHDASRVKHVYGFEGVALKPIGSKGSKAYQLGLMENNVLTINYLQSKITAVRSAA